MKVQTIKDFISERTPLDLDRIRVSPPQGFQLQMVVGVRSCTENEHDILQNLLEREGPKGYDYEVVRDDDPEKPPAYDLPTLHTMIAKLGEAPDGQLDEIFSKRCRELPSDTPLDETLKFIRNMRDECVYGAGGSGFVMTLFNCLLEDYPEPKKVKSERRAELEEKYGMR